MEKKGFVMKKDTRHLRGQGLVEFVLVLPLFLVLLFGMVEFGRAWMTKNIITGAAREAVRELVVVPHDNSVGGEAYTRAVNILISAGLDSNNWKIDLRQIPPTPPDLTPTMEAYVEYNLPMIIGALVPGLPSDNLLLTTTSTMRME